MTNGSVLRATGLVKSFGRKRVLRGLDLALRPGAVTVLLGANGAGKSTLMRLALGVLRPDGGTLAVAGHDPLVAPRLVRTQVGFVPDVPDVPPWMTLRDLLRFLAPQYPAFDPALARALTAQLGVPERRAFRRMSRGEGMKAMLVAALAPRPALLLLDEPFAGLDPLVREEVLHGVIGALRDGERTVLCATHDLEIAARLADRVAVLAHGMIRRHGTLADVLGEEEPAHVPDGLRGVLAAAEKETVRC